MFVCKDCIDKFEPVVALSSFYKTCEICGKMGTCLDLAPNVKRIDTPDIESEILELIIDHKDGKFTTWSMRDPNDPPRKFGKDDMALIQQVVDGFPTEEPEKEGERCPVCQKEIGIVGDAREDDGRCRLCGGRIEAPADEPEERE